MDKINYDNLTAQELREQLTKNVLTLQSLSTTALEQLLAYETELLCHGSGDMELITCCSELLTAKENYETETLKTTLDFASLVDKTLKDHVEVINPHQTQPKHTQKQRRFSLKHIAIIAAVFLILSATTVGVASAYGVNISEEIRKIISQEDGARKDIEGFTFYHASEVKYYSSLEEIREEKNWDILYPTKFPENVTIDMISSDKSERGTDHIFILTNDKDIQIGIERNAPNEDKWAQHDDFYEVNGVKYHVYQRNDSYRALSYYNGDYYSIQAGNYDDLILIIDNLKVLED
ncbi:MAG: hypothetical protein E7586_02480 [Ruminococcaceae bacterium]|nr:hypothetical protein [Oscillospiraceae bacterium]